MNTDLHSSFATAAGGRARLAQNFAARTFGDLDRRADREIQEGVAFALEGCEAIERAARRLGLDDPAFVDQLKAEHVARLRSAWAAYQGAGSRVLNWFVTGSARFPVRSNEKRMQTEHNRLTEYLAIGKGAGAWAEKRIKRRIRDQLGPVGVADHELERARAKLKARECRQETMRLVNAAIRRHRNQADAAERIRAELEAQGCQVEAAIVPELLKPDFAGRVGFADYQLKNNNAEIRRLRTRAAELERRAAAVAAAAEDPAELEPPADDQVRIVENALEQRVQIYFPDKPEARIRALLKSRGFRWAPSSGAWQRQLTNNAIAAARAIADQVNAGPVEPIGS